MTAETYRDAAVEHVGAARTLYDARHWVLSMYVSGLAVECVLRAHRVRVNPEFDSRHDLHELLRLTGFDVLLPAHDRPAAAAALATLLNIWSNSHRFHSSKALRYSLARRGLFKGIKGDFLKELSRRMVNAAALLVSIGVSKWHLSKRK